jgi:N-acetylneuraminate synthase
VKRVTVIAEAGVNHNGDLKTAEALVRAAAEAGADYVKFQMFKASSLSTIGAPQAEYQVQNIGNESSQSEMLKELELDENQHLHLKDYAEEIGIGFLSSPFDLESLAKLQKMGLDYMKIPSGEITNRPLLEAIAKRDTSIILSTGMCTMEEISDALEVLYDGGVQKSQVTVLHCNTEYPTPLADVNLRAMDSIRERFGCSVGYSDHTLGELVPIIATVRGAEMIEKHLTLDKEMSGPDHAASMEPLEFKLMVDAIRKVPEVLGESSKKPSASEKRNIPIARKSIYYSKNLPLGHQLNSEDFIMLRPGDGLSPMSYREFLGKTLMKDVREGEALSKEHVE